MNKLKKIKEELIKQKSPEYATPEYHENLKRAIELLDDAEYILQQSFKKAILEKISNLEEFFLHASIYVEARVEERDSDHYASMKPIVKLGVVDIGSMYEKEMSLDEINADLKIIKAAFEELT